MSKKRPTTIQDIAHEAGVSVATVSRVLNNTATVAEEKMEAVRNAIEKLDYTPNTTAQGLVWGTTSTVGVLAQHMGSPFFGELLHGIESTLRQSRYAPIFAVSEWDLQKDLAALDTLTRRQVDALIIIGGAIPSSQLLKLSKSTHLVVVGRVVEGIEEQCVHISNYDAAYEATSYLIEMGHHEIAHITGNLKHEDAQERKAGYLQALIDAEIEPQESLIIAGDFTEASAVLAVENLIANRKQHGFTAIFAGNDQLATGARLALYRRGIRVPEDISLIGFDDLPNSRYLTPPLTTVRQPAFEMGSQAASVVLSLLEKRPIDNNQLQHELIIRESVSMR